MPLRRPKTMPGFAPRQTSSVRAQVGCTTAVVPHRWVRPSGLVDRFRGTIVVTSGRPPGRSGPGGHKPLPVGVDTTHRRAEPWVVPPYAGMDPMRRSMSVPVVRPITAGEIGRRIPQVSPKTATHTIRSAHAWPARRRLGRERQGRSRGEIQLLGHLSWRHPAAQRRATRRRVDTRHCYHRIGDRVADRHQHEVVVSASAVDIRILKASAVVGRAFSTAVQSSAGHRKPGPAAWRQPMR
jgi:hypothetical protein